MHSANVALFSFPFGLSLLGLMMQPVVALQAGGPVETADLVADRVGGILAYSYWPERRGPVALCLIGTSPLSGRIASGTLPNGRPVRVTRADNGQRPAPDCDAIYLAGLAPAPRRAIIDQTIGRAIVTIIDNDGPCLSGAMFCLHVRGTNVAMDVNLDAVSRGLVRIDPRVLALSRRPAALP